MTNMNNTYADLVDQTFNFPQEDFQIVNEYLQYNGQDIKALIDKYWTDIAKAWFDGKDDPRIRIVSVKPVDAYYWDTKYSKIVSLVKIGWAAVTGANMEDGGIEGTLKV